MKEGGGGSGGAFSSVSLTRSEGTAESGLCLSTHAFSII